MEASLPEDNVDPFAGDAEAAPEGPHGLLSMEVIGDNTNARLRDAQQMARCFGGATAGRLFDLGPNRQPWVAQILGIYTSGKFRRNFLRGQKDYSQANSMGSRGVYLRFLLSPGVYQVHRKLSWKSERTYFARCFGGEVAEITEQEATEWLKNKR